MHHVMGVCCIVFDIDWMLYEFFLNKKKSFHVFAFYAISNIFIIKYIWGGGVVKNTKVSFYMFMFSSHFMLFLTFLEKEGGVGGGVFLSKIKKSHFLFCEGFIT